MKDEYDFSAGERGKFFGKAAPPAFLQTGIGQAYADREGYTIVVFPEHIHIGAKTMLATRNGKQVVLTKAKKRKRARKI